VLTVLLTGVALALIAGFGFVAFRRAGDAGLPGQLWRGGLILVGVLLAWALLDQPLGATVLIGGGLVLAGGLAVVIAEPRDAAALEAPQLGSASQ